MRTLASLFTSLVIASAIAGAQTPGKAAPGVGGAWNLMVKGPAAHGDMPATMQLRQEGKAITGTFAVHGTEHTLKGEFSDATLTLETTDTPADKSLSFTAKLKDDGSLAGYLSGPMGDMQWTATRSGSRIAGFRQRVETATFV